MQAISPALNLTQLNNPELKEEIKQKVATVAEKHFDVSIDEIKQHANREHLKQLKEKKGRIDYRLYPVFVEVQKLLDKCLATTDELLTKDEDGNIIFSEPGLVFADISSDHKEMMDQLKELYLEVKDQPEELRKGFIKEKVSQTRYTKRGAEYAHLFSELGEKIFALSTVCLNIQMTLADLTAETEEDH